MDYEIIKLEQSSTAIHTRDLCIEEKQSSEMSGKFRLVNGELYKIVDDFPPI